MGLNTYPCNPFPPSTDQMDADTLEANVSKLESDVDQLKSGLTNVEAAINGDVIMRMMQHVSGGSTYAIDLYHACNINYNRWGFMILKCSQSGVSSLETVMLITNGDDICEVMTSDTNITSTFTDGKLTITVTNPSAWCPQWLIIRRDFYNAIV